MLPVFSARSRNRLVGSKYGGCDIDLVRDPEASGGKRRPSGPF